MSGASIDNIASVAAADQSDPEQGNDASVQGITVRNVSGATDPADPGVLASTGSQVGRLTLLALALLVAGLALILLGRRQDDTQEPSAPW